MVQVIKNFKLRKWQYDVFQKFKRFNVLVIHRRAGKTVLGVNWLMKTLFECKTRNPKCGYIAPTFAQAKKVAWDMFKEYCKDIQGTTFNESELKIDPDPEANILAMLQDVVLWLALSMGNSLCFEKGWAIFGAGSKLRFESLSCTFI